LRFVGEFVVIVVGVLVAFAVQESADTADERRLQATYLSRLYDDIYEDSVFVAQQLRIQGSIRASAEAALAILEAGSGRDETDVAALATEMVRAARVGAWRPAERSTFSELISSGQLRLIRDDTLRASLLNYYRGDEQEEGRMDGRDLSYRRLVEGITGPRIWMPVTEQCVAVMPPSEREWRPFDCQPSPPPSGLDQFWSDIQASPESVRLLRQTALWLDLTLSRLGGDQSQQAALLSQLREARAG